MMMAAGTYITQPTSVLEAGYFQCHARSSAGPSRPRCSEDEDAGATMEMPGRWPHEGPEQSNVSDSAGGPEADSPQFMPLVRSGWWSEIGSRRCMEDAHVCIDDLDQHLGTIFIGQSPGAFTGILRMVLWFVNCQVFDGHGGKDAANFVREHLLRFIVEDVAFPAAVDQAVRHAFLRADHAFAQACMNDQGLASGTTALTALIFGRTLLVANAGDCRAVLSKKGKAVEMSRDHKPCCSLERSRIEALGGFVDDGYLNGQLAVARALGDWHMKGLKELGTDGPLSAEPELQQAVLTEDDEFLIIGCDGLWDVFSSQNAVDFARKKLQQHNDPERCSRELIDEAIRRETGDNLTVVTVCFQKQAPPNLGVWRRKGVTKSISVEGLRNLQLLLDNNDH